MAEETAATECRADRSGVRERCGKICGIGRAGDAVHVRPVVPVQWDSEAHEAIRVLQRIVDRVRPPSIIWFGQRVILAFDQQTKSCRRRARVVALGLEAEYRAGRCRDLEAIVIEEPAIGLFRFVVTYPMPRQLQSCVGFGVAVPWVNLISHPPSDAAEGCAGPSLYRMSQVDGASGSGCAHPDTTAEHITAATTGISMKRAPRRYWAERGGTEVGLLLPPDRSVPPSSFGRPSAAARRTYSLSLFLSTFTPTAAFLYSESYTREALIAACRGHHNTQHDKNASKDDGGLKSPRLSGATPRTPVKGSRRWVGRN